MMPTWFLLQLVARAFSLCQLRPDLNLRLIHRERQFSSNNRDKSALGPGRVETFFVPQ